MKAILGIDPAGAYRRGENVLLRLGLPELTVDGLAVVEPMLPDMSWPTLSDTHPLTEIMRLREKAAEEGLNEAAERFAQAGVSFAKHQQVGTPVQALEAWGEKMDARLIVVGSERKGRFGSLFMGSVTKGLCSHAKTNVLIGKKETAGTGGVHAVFATDLSEYAYRCADELLALAPRGLNRITVLTAYGIDEGLQAHLIPGDASLEEFLPAAVRARTEAAVQKVADRFRAFEVPVDVVVVEDEANHAIGETMKSTGADLLILGAQGHSFLERLTLGSTAMHEVLSGENNLLLLKPISTSAGDSA